mmetsp:Transcript_9464/g.20494  ORF Transcript_9464/g.20494 Transcript_9464/m.20494 type:complete len:250 (+) Transcript_9464:144-893(+)
MSTMMTATETVPDVFTTMASDEPRIQDAAMSLCALGRSRSNSPRLRDDHVVESSTTNQNAATPCAVAPDTNCGNGTGETSYLRQKSIDLNLENQLQISESTLPPLAPPSASIVKPTKTKAAPKKAARRDSSAKHNAKIKDPKRDTSVPFDEMKRLMRVYGSLKCLRNRTPVDSGRTAKMESVKRKFYRWFPDLDERFVRTPEGWYKPKGGHEEEMRHREMMRKEDQECLVKKRNLKRSGGKLGADQTRV